MALLSLFQMPRPMKITGRSSSITNSFINSIIPVVFPNEEQVREAFEILGMTPETYQCAYCGDVPTEWDHLRPLVKNKKPTGYISEIHNLVPTCGKCNQSKGNKEWKAWMVSNAVLSPTKRGVKDIPGRIARLERYEAWGIPTHMEFESIVGEEIWTRHWHNWQRVQDLMRESQVLAAEINAKVATAYKALSSLVEHSDSAILESGLKELEERFHALIQSRLEEFGVPLPKDLPHLEGLRATKQNPGWFDVDGMYGGFSYYLLSSESPAKLIVESWSRIIGGSGQRHLITQNSTELVEAGFA